MEMPFENCNTVTTVTLGVGVEKKLRLIEKKLVIYS